MKLLFYFVTILGLVASPIHAKIGDTETEVKVANAGLKTDESDIDKRAKVVVFTNYDKGTQYAVGVLDGKVESEIFTRLDDTPPDKAFVLGTLTALTEIWEPIPCDGDCAAVVSADKMYFSRIGNSKELRKNYVFWIFSDTWRRYAIGKKQTLAL